MESIADLELLLSSVLNSLTGSMASATPPAIVDMQEQIDFSDPVQPSQSWSES